MQWRFLINKVGEYSRIDKCVLDSTDLGNVLKILSIARYMVMTEDALDNFDDFALSHKLLYDFGISSDICYNLIDEIGYDTNLEQNLFYNLSSLVKKYSNSCI